MDQNERQDNGRSGLSYHMEGFIPLLIVLVLVVLILSSQGMINLGGIPVLGAFFPSAGGMNVLVLGESNASMMDILNSSDAKAMGIQVTPFSDPNSLFPNYLDGFDVVMLHQTGADKTVDRKSREEIARRVKNGGKLIVIQNAGTKVTDDASVLGWGLGYGEVIPVECVNVLNPGEASCDTPISISGVFQPAKPNHKVLEGIVKYPAQGTRHFNIYGVRPKGEVLAYISETSTGTPYPAVVVGSVGFGGATVYFNFDPSTDQRMPQLLLNSISYLTGY
ncbi:MAG: hypothetical protein J7K00_02265 [Candidatus Diapherotrites archaeon]|nr:hypothetical protein [Candidatus Diapherotrites archaeon]